MKQNFLRALLAALLALVLCVSMIACTGNKDDQQNSGEPAASDTADEQPTNEQPTDEEPTKPVDPDDPDEGLTNQGDNTVQDWGNDIIA